MRERLRNLPNSEALDACEMFDRTGLQKVVDAHIDGRQSNTRLLLILLTLESWIRQFGGLTSE
jgi:hypothetical protein